MATTLAAPLSGDRLLSLGVRKNDTGVMGGCSADPGWASLEGTGVKKVVATPALASGICEDMLLKGGVHTSVRGAEAEFRALGHRHSSAMGALLRERKPSLLPAEGRPDYNDAAKTRVNERRFSYRCIPSLQLGMLAKAEPLLLNENFRLRAWPWPWPWP